MKKLNASFTDLNGKVIKIKSEDELIKMIEFAAQAIGYNEANEIALPQIFSQKVLAYWQHRLACLKLIKEKHFKTLFQLWQAGEISGFGSFQTTILKAYQIADSNNTKKLEAAFPEWFVNSYTL